MDDKEDKQEQIEMPDKRTPAVEQPSRFKQEVEKTLENKEAARDDEIVSAELRREIEMMELDDKLKLEAEKKAEKIEFLGEKEKIERLLQIAREKGVVFAIQIAKKMNEPYLLDILHDTLAQEGLYKNFIQPTNDDKNNNSNPPVTSRSK
jgi:hypothetical protein